MKTSKTPSAIRRFAGWSLSTLLTMGIVAGAGFAVFHGAGALAERADAVDPPPAAPLTRVAVRPLRIEDGYVARSQFVGQIESGTEAVVSFELGGRLTSLSVEEGDTVAAGQEIARLDTALLEAERDRLAASRAATLAQLGFAERRLDRAETLRGQGFSSQETLDRALANRDELTSRIAEIDAAAASVAINLEKSVLFAPFDGQVGARTADGGETLAAGQPVVTLIETGAPRVRIGLPLDVAADDLHRVDIEIAGSVYPASLARLRPDIDPVTRTRTALFELDAAAPAVFGQTVRLIVGSRTDAAGAWVPVDALQEGAGGVWTVLVVDDGTVRLAAVEVLHAAADRAFVRGTFEDGAQLIDTGAHRVVPGQAVSVLQDEG